MRDCEVITEAEVEELTKKAYQQGRADAIDEISSIRVGKTLHQIARMIASGEIPKDVYNKFLSNIPIGFMTPMEICKIIIEEQKNA